MELLWMSTLYFTVTFIDFSRLKLIVSPVVAGLQWVNVPGRLEDSVFVDIFDLKYI